MIQVYTNPLLLDFIKVCLNMPQDEREQLEAFTGEKYDVDAAAIGNFTVPGPKWVIKADEDVLCIGGFVPQRPGVYRDFMLTTPAAWETHWFAITRIARRAMDAMLKETGPSAGVHRPGRPPGRPAQDRDLVQDSGLYSGSPALAILCRR